MSSDLEDILGNAADNFFSAAAGGLGKAIGNMADRAFKDQEEDEFVEIDSDGKVHPYNPSLSSKGVALRDQKAEY
ncbi:hypothetical protein H6S82_29535 [Planktothrix sp. FACHB-1355]|uniref:Uncharacterized protein n=1 Tax=Aerosakkonema funiforme FACHB-1375 TaxID=2949571 RepID=A0A926VHC8_9CYAN|nr:MULTISPECIES: hypothetical protein [Oscillatoriales]MBD2183735.1 hypothetical protein [Aerosakkonema funiforme FACHB-1375]MBD3562953.1 hypothetical protein [Planktothrix sp. FACHB-1355]